MDWCATCTRYVAARLIQAFVIYCFFNLLVEYLSGEAAILAMLHGRPPTNHVFPLNLFLPPMDLSDPYTFLSVKRGIHRAYGCAYPEYVQFKPLLAVATVILKALGRYEDGRLNVQNGYTWIALLYSTSCRGLRRRFRVCCSVLPDHLLGLSEPGAQTVPCQVQISVCERCHLLQLLARSFYFDPRRSGCSPAQYVSNGAHVQLGRLSTIPTFPRPCRIC